MVRGSCTTLYPVCIVIAFTDILVEGVDYKRPDLDPGSCVYMMMVRKSEEYHGRKAYLFTLSEHESRWLI